MYVSVLFDIINVQVCIGLLSFFNFYVLGNALNPIIL